MSTSFVKIIVGHFTALGLVFGQVAIADAAPKQPNASSGPNFVSSPVIQGNTPTPASVNAAPVAETEKERKARLKAEEKAQKQAEKVERDRLRAEERERRRAESRARGGSNTGKAIAGCVVGGLLGGLLAKALGGGDKAVIGSAAAGCAAGIAFATLTKKENENLSSYVNNDFVVQDETCNKIWYAEESKQNVNVTCGQTTYQNARHTFYVEDDVSFDPSNIQVAESVKYASNSVRLRSAPMTTGANNIIGGYNRGDKLLAYGTTKDGKWTYIVDRLPDGGYELLGYAATGLLVDRAPSPVARATHYARLKTAPTASNRAVAKRHAIASTVNTRAASTKPAKKVEVVANTRCKTVNVSVGKETKSTSSCGGAKLAFLLIEGTKGKKA